MPLSLAEVLAEIKSIIVDVVSESDQTFGAPGGHIYAALMGVGLSLSQYQYIMDSLVREGRLARRGQCYFAP